jgi:sphingomyelin phosphodiesterase 2
VVLTEKVPGHEFSYSDHFGLESTLSILTDVNEVGTSSAIHPSNVGELSNTATNTTIQALAACYRFSKHRASREMTIAGICIFLLVGVTIGSSWLPHAWINPIFMLFTIFLAWFATTMFYEGFIYGQWECNALQNVIEELEIHKKGLELMSVMVGS